MYNSKYSNIAKRTPLISVVLPVYNSELFLAEAIESILSQTISDFEFIIVDDGSTDNSRALLKQYQHRDSRIRLVLQENKKLSTSLNNAIDLAHGVWVARMDHDDIALPHRFERQLKWLEESGADICGSWVKFFGTSDTRILKHPQTDKALKMELLFGAPFAHPTVMMRTQLIKQLRYDIEWEVAEDYDLWERASHAGWKMTNVPEVLLLYRKHTTQISTSASSMQRLLSQKIQRRHLNFVFASMQLPLIWVDEIMKIREPASPIPNMDAVDSAFNELLFRNQGEAREIIFDHVTRLYFRVAAICPDVVVRWSNLHKKYGAGYAIGIKLKLWLLCVLQIRSNSAFYYRLKKLFFSLSR